MLIELNEIDLTDVIGGAGSLWGPYLRFICFGDNPNVDQ
jgi:hypothetical protein